MTRLTATATLGAAFEEVWENQPAFLKRIPLGTEGLVIRHPVKDGPIATAGIEEMEIITAINGRAVSRRDDLIRLVRENAPGATVRLQLLKPDSHTSREVNVTLGCLEAGWPEGS